MKMKFMYKKLIAFIMAAVMLCNMIPASAAQTLMDEAGWTHTAGIRYKVEREDGDTSSEITVVAEEASQTIELTGIRLPDGSIAEASGGTAVASYTALKNGEYDFTILVKKLKTSTSSDADRSTPSDADEATPSDAEEDEDEFSTPSKASPSNATSSDAYYDEDGELVVPDIDIDEETSIFKRVMSLFSVRSVENEAEEETEIPVRVDVYSLDTKLDFKISVTGDGDDIIDENGVLPNGTYYYTISLTPKSADARNIIVADPLEKAGDSQWMGWADSITFDCTQSDFKLNANYASIYRLNKGTKEYYDKLIDGYIPDRTELENDATWTSCQADNIPTCSVLAIDFKDQVLKNGETLTIKIKMKTPIDYYQNADGSTKKLFNNAFCSAEVKNTNASTWLKAETAASNTVSLNLINDPKINFTLKADPDRNFIGYKEKVTYTMTVNNRNTIDVGKTILEWRFDGVVDKSSVVMVSGDQKIPLSQISGIKYEWWVDRFEAFDEGDVSGSATVLTMTFPSLAQNASYTFVATAENPHGYSAYKELQDDGSKTEALGTKDSSSMPSTSTDDQVGRKESWYDDGKFETGNKESPDRIEVGYWGAPYVGCYIKLKELCGVTQWGYGSYIEQDPGTPVLTIEKSSNPQSGTQTDPALVTKGQEIVYRLDVTNTATIAANNVLVEDTFDEKLSVDETKTTVLIDGIEKSVSDTDISSKWLEDATGKRNVIFTIPEMKSGAKYSFFIHTTVKENSQTDVVIPNTASASVTYSSWGTEKKITVSSNTTYHKIIEGNFTSGKGIELDWTIKNTGEKSVFETSTMTINGIPEGTELELYADLPVSETGTVDKNDLAGKTPIATLTTKNNTVVIDGWEAANSLPNVSVNDEAKAANQWLSGTKEWQKHLIGAGTSDYTLDSAKKSISYNVTLYCKSGSLDGAQNFEVLVTSKAVQSRNNGINYKNGEGFTDTETIRLLRAKKS